MRPTNAAAAATAALLCLATIFLESSPSWPLVLYHLLVDGSLILIWLLSAFGLGSLFIQRDPKLAPLHLITSIALGLGLFSLLMLAIGLAGWLSHLTAIALLLPGILIAAASLWPHRKKLDPALHAWAAAPARWNWLWLPIMPLLGISITAALFPPGLLWGNEPNGYDVVEYHLQVPREWFQSGRITPLDYNVFSYFPFNMEMHYLLAMELRNGPWAGMYLAQFMHVTMWILMILAIYAAAGPLPAILSAAIPWDWLLAPVAYVEGALVLYAALAAIWALRWQKTRAPRDILVAGVMAGFACGVKLTAVPWILLALPIALLFSSPWRHSLRAAPLFLVAGLLTFSPWLIRNEIWCRNPVFPEATNIFGIRPFTAIEAQRWQKAYIPKTSPIPSFFTQIVSDPAYGFALIPMAILAIVLTRRSPATRLLATLLILLTLIWIFFTHLQSRFYVLAIPWIALLSAELPPNRWRLLIPSVALIAAIVALIDLQSRLLYFTSENQSVSGNLIGLEDFWPLLKVPQTIPGLALVADARAFLYQLPMSRLHYRTVFNVNSTPNTSPIQDWLNPPPPPTWTILIDLPELKRLTTYYGIHYPAPAQLAPYSTTARAKILPLSAPAPSTSPPP